MAGKSVIVFPTDFSNLSLTAMPWVRQMAEAFKADVHCIYVVEEPQIYATLDMGPVPIPSAEELASSARTRLEAFVKASTKELGARPEAKVLIGRPADEIVRYAKDHDARMLVMTTHGYSGVKHVLLGSTTEAVLRHASCPVLSIRTS
jgi:universal stress protein A